MPYIGSCGHEVWSKEATLCRKCWIEARRKEPKRCQDCGVVLERGGNGGVSRSTRCWACFVKHNASLNPCENCGKPRKNAATLQGGGRRSKLCRDCYNADREAHSKERQCSKEGCSEPPMGLGLCRGHYKTKRSLENDSRKGRIIRLKAYIRSQPCAVCGFDQWPGECARIRAGQPYAEDNVVSLCRNCHYGYDHGYLTLPDPLPNIRL